MKESNVIIKDARLPVKGIDNGGNKGYVWLVIQSCSDPEAENPQWESLMGPDVPEWVTSEKHITILMDGEMINHNPAQGCKWYRGVVTEAPKAN